MRGFPRGLYKNLKKALRRFQEGLKKAPRRLRKPLRRRSQEVFKGPKKESHLRSSDIALQPMFVLLFDLCFVVCPCFASVMDHADAVRRKDQSELLKFCTTQTSRICSTKKQEKHNSQPRYLLAFTHSAIVRCSSLNSKNVVGFLAFTHELFQILCQLICAASVIGVAWCHAQF